LADGFVLCRALSKNYATASGVIEALHSVDARFALGEIVAVVGASGSGKSTLLRLLAGLERPSSGDLVVGGRELARAAPRVLRRHRRYEVSYVSQSAAENFVSHLTVGEHAGSEPMLADLLGRFGLGRRLGSLPAELSGGEQARAAFALALIRGAPLIVADEPTAELDGESAAALLTAIRAHAGPRVGVVIATHDPEVVGIADRVLTLDRGRVVEGSEPSPGAWRPRSSAAAGRAVLQAERVSKSYRRGPYVTTAVRDASIELRQGELATLLGRSGSGKTTLLTLLGGWQLPDRGGFRWRGVAAEPSALPWDELGYLPQRFGLLPELSVRENVQQPARLAGKLAERAAAAESLLERLGLAGLADRPPQETSIGQQQRAALARALVLGPAVVLLDEPTSHQDAGWRDRVWELLADLAAGGTSCLIATHEEEAALVSSRVWRVEEGAVVGEVAVTSCC